VILRILRFVSPNPWGSPHAEGGRRRNSLFRIASKIWGTRSLSSNSQTPTSFTAGSQVLWTPVIVLPNGTIRPRDQQSIPDCKLGWIATRQLPIKISRRSEEPSSIPPCQVDITHIFAEPRGTEVMFDCRFILRFRPPFPTVLTFPVNSSSQQILIVSHGLYFLPRILFRRANEPDTVLWELREAYVNPFESMLVNGGVEWVEIQHARVFDAL
jgi:tRNA(Ile)-lysidine synthase